MRTVTYGSACSLDGFIAAADGGLDWLHFSTDVQDIMAAYWTTVDTMLLGRKSWEVVAAQSGAGGAGGGRADDRGAPKVATYVFSRTLREITAPGVTLVSSDAGEFVHELKRRPGRGICVMGGGELARSLFAAGVVDEVGLNVHPVLLGAGIPAFLDSGRRVSLALSESRTIDGGCVFSNYRVRDSA